MYSIRMKDTRVLMVRGRTWQNLERVVGENSVPEKQHLVTGQVARECPNQPFESYPQPANTSKQYRTHCLHYNTVQETRITKQCGRQCGESEYSRLNPDGLEVEEELRFARLQQRLELEAERDDALSVWRQRVEAEEVASVELPEHEVQQHGVVVDITERRHWKTSHSYANEL